MSDQGNPGNKRPREKGTSSPEGHEVKHVRLDGEETEGSGEESEGSGEGTDSSGFDGFGLEGDGEPFDIDDEMFRDPPGGKGKENAGAASLLEEMRAEEQARERARAANLE